MNPSTVQKARNLAAEQKKLGDEEFIVNPMEQGGPSFIPPMGEMSADAPGEFISTGQAPPVEGSSASSLSTRMDQPAGGGQPPMDANTTQTENTTTTPPVTPPPAPAVDTGSGQFYDSPPGIGTSAAGGHTGSGEFGAPAPQNPHPPTTIPGGGGWEGETVPGPTGGGTTTTTSSSSSGASVPSDLPVNMRPPGSPDSQWGDNRPEFLGESPDMPEATRWEVDRNQTVAGQMASLMENDNPVFQSIREATLRAHAARGGRNSLMASSAAVSMMADMAFRIGSQDAATMARSAEFNAAMSNQFGLAEQRFIQNALLSDQNFRQGVMVIREQHRSTLEQIAAQTQGNLAAIGAQTAGQMALEDRRHGNTLQVMDRGHAQTLERDELGFQHNWMLNEQGQAHTLERSDRETDNAIRGGSAQHGWQMQLQYMSEVGANGRALLGTIGDIRSNPNITAAQATAAVRDATTNFNQINSMFSSFYTMPPPGTGGGAGGGATGPGGAPASGQPNRGSVWNSPNANYLDYGSSTMMGPGRGYSLGQGGYQAYAPPTARFWSGSGTVGQPQYGSNRNYASTQTPTNPTQPPPARPAPPGGP